MVTPKFFDDHPPLRQKLNVWYLSSARAHGRWKPCCFISPPLDRSVELWFQPRSPTLLRNIHPWPSGEVKLGDAAWCSSHFLTVGSTPDTINGTAKNHVMDVDYGDTLSGGITNFLVSWITLYCLLNFWLLLECYLEQTIPSIFLAHLQETPNRTGQETPSTCHIINWYCYPENQS